MKPLPQRNLLKVVICIDRGQKYGGDVLKGITKYVNVYGPWSLLIDPRFYGEYERGWLKNWQGDGMLAYVEDLRLARLLKDSGIPVVEIFGHRYDLGLPQVSPDGKEIGRLAAQHLLERNFRHFAYFGYQDHQWSERRQQGFVETVNAAGFQVEVHLVKRNYKTLSHAQSIQRQLGRQILQLPLPIGILACSDRHAQRILVACHEANISLPEEVALIGTGNDEELCHLSNPPLSSVMHDTERIGYEAARLLDQMMAGKVMARDIGTIFVPPVGIAVRRSTEVMAIHDRVVANMVRFIREHAFSGMDVSQMAAELGVSRSTFYRRFQSVLGHSPHEELLRIQLHRARDLLLQTDLAIERIAEMSGFQNTEYFYVAFKRETGMTPRAYRLRA
jgi:LacI family transcriptional regulator